jgi:hypothetical protein
MRGGSCTIVELTPKERDMIVMVLENYLPELRGEIASGVRHDWKIELKAEEAVLKAGIEKLKQHMSLRGLHKGRTAAVVMRK